MFAASSAPCATGARASDNGRSYRSRAFGETAATLGTRLQRTSPYRPQTNGKAERFIKTLQHEWAFQRQDLSNRKRLEALGDGFARRHTPR